MKRIVPVLVVLAVAAAAATWYLHSRSTVTTADALGGSGTVETSPVTVSPQVSGRIVAAPAQEGAAVHAGEVLYRLDATTLRLQVQQASAGVTAAKAAWQQAKDDDKGTAQIAAAKAAWDQAVVALKMAQVQLGYATVTAPRAGVLTNVVLGVGENAVVGSTLAVISDPGDLTVTIYVPEDRIGQVRVGQAGSLTTDSTTRTYHASVTFIGTQAEYTPASIETKEQRVKLVYQVRLRVTDADAALKAGMPADVVLH